MCWNDLIYVIIKHIYYLGRAISYGNQKKNQYNGGSKNKEVDVIN